jgi:glycine betaine/proline transport system substrate-binding protein
MIWIKQTALHVQWMSIKLILICSLCVSFCATAAPKGTVKLVYVDWSSEIISTNVVRVLLERLGYEVSTEAMDTFNMWQAVATGKADATVSAWLNNTQGRYLEAVKDRVESLGSNLEGTQVGLAVPDYVPISSIEELNEHVQEFGGRIIGIDPGAGIMGKTVEARKIYELYEYQIIPSHETSMMRSLAEAIDTRQWIVITGWIPHWMFAKWRLKFLTDSKQVYDTKGFIATIVRKGLAKERPELYRILDQFHWNAAEMQKIMLWNAEDAMMPYHAAQRWLRENPEYLLRWSSQ